MDVNQIKQAARLLDTLEKIAEISKVASERDNIRILLSPRISGGDYGPLSHCAVLLDEDLTGFVLDRLRDYLEDLLEDCGVTP